MPKKSWRSSVVTTVSFIAFSAAVTVRAADDKPASGEKRPSRDVVETAHKKCEESSGVTKGQHPTHEQHKAMHECMKKAMTAAGFANWRPHGPGEGPHHHEGPPPGDEAPEGGRH